MNRNLTWTFVLLLLAAVIMLPGVAFSEPRDIAEGAKCHLCGMKVDPGSAFSAQIVDGGKMLPFCDIGDMLYHYNKQEEKPSEMYVRDKQSLKWIDAREAAYVKSDSFSTPMGWGIAAFSDKAEAAAFGKPMTFDEALSAVK
ncbi:MAG: nitrous oxide reductase accessory protein NosL [Nitrospirota bacterium]|jgi:copper chaperone NosL